MKPYAFGVDIGGTTVKIGLFSAVGKLLDSWEIPTRTENEGTLILPDIAKSIEGKLKDRGIEISEVEGIGVGVPGPVLTNGIVDQCVNLGWGVFDVRTELSKLLEGIPVEVGNDANVAALGEQWCGGGKGRDNVVMVTLGTGVGGGIIVRGRILNGNHGAAGEIGHIKVKDDEKEKCACGKKGCLEQYASATGIVRVAKRRLKKDKETRSTLRKIKDLTAKDVLDAAKKGDPMAVDVMERVGKLLGEAIATVTCVLNPDVVVIGGGVSKAGPYLLDLIQRYYRPAAFHSSQNVVFKLAELGNDAGMYGAVRMILNEA